LGGQLEDVVRSIANKLIGAGDIGTTGENLLADALASFPPGWIERDFRVGGKIVEFAVVLADQSRLQIDSKFVVPHLLESLGQEPDPQKRLELIDQIEAAVAAKAREASKYIDPSKTVPLAVAAVPDAAYKVCKKAHYEAINSGVIVISYSNAVPFVLAVYKLQLQYASSLDRQLLEDHLRNIEASVRQIQENFEGRIKQAGDRISHAYDQCTQELRKITASLSALRTPALPAQDQPAPQLPDATASKLQA
jgi:DNA anti-recombination protein RmuC